MLDLNHQMDCDVLVCGERETTKGGDGNEAEAAGMRGVNAGALANAVVVEGMTSIADCHQHLEQINEDSYYGYLGRLELVNLQSPVSISLYDSTALT
ncbi:MAG: hypothetical protein H6668_11775 [Ardenticatenaceae bacterium]|nr:hypothetical protein [Ardenticatenaceae bacterium]